MSDAFDNVEKVICCVVVFEILMLEQLFCSDKYILIYRLGLHNNIDVFGINLIHDMFQGFSMEKARQ